jgi:hypothetical protein
MATETNTELSEVEAMPMASRAAKSKRTSGDVKRRMARAPISVSNGDAIPD